MPLAVRIALALLLALALLAGVAPSPLGQLVTFEAQGFRFGGFRFTGAPEPDHAPRFLDPAGIAAGDFVVDLRAETEAPLVRPDAHRLPVTAFGPGGPLPDPGQRAVLCCRSGLRSWQAATRLRSHWDGEIALIALGDVQQETQT